MAAVAIDDTSRAETGRQKNLLLRVLDALAEWVMRQELRIISRNRSDQL